jgi:hypothetical protein
VPDVIVEMERFNWMLCCMELRDNNVSVARGIGEQLKPTGNFWPYAN